MSALAVLTAYQGAYARLRAATTDQITKAWSLNGGLTDEAQNSWLRTALPLVQGAEAAAVVLVDGFTTTLGREAGSSQPVGLDVKALTGTALRGVDPADVYARAVIEARVAIASGSTFDEAMTAGLTRARTLAETDVLLAQRAAISEVAKRTPAITGYRRVLTGASCALCASAATRDYGPYALMPIHSHCDCGMAPIYRTGSEPSAYLDPGDIANRSLLADMAARGPRYWDQRGFGVTADGDVFTKKPAEPLGSSIDGPDTDWRNRAPIDVTVHHHGELGPVLTPAGQHFTGPSEIPA
ncbi:hypothetical protein KSP35_13090 [Aquihabitans sp. G128]|uniref:VG15 protein n=1 Tax=Aquihabitans sp. G128 TaxID=2849779 RepID=UPI001C2135CD|nr:hypothetical protein [Aquihabitans sp. G128]QXC59338.1 hypothetical protein KSP35_13090 [Aquihabitans sp. G128]